MFVRILTKTIVVLCTSLYMLTVNADSSQLKLEMILAKRGDVSSMYRVAAAYEDGTDVAKDLKQSFDWYMQAANKGHPPSQYKVGEFYEYGYGTEKDLKTAMEWYKKARDNGSSQASKRLDKAAFTRSEEMLKKRRLALQERLDREDRERQLAAQKAAQKEAEQKRLNKQREAEAARKKAQEIRDAKKAAAQKQAKREEPKPKAVAIPDILNVVLTGKWSNTHGAADYLPSSTTTCLQSGDNELTCFSGEKARVVNGMNVTYTTKSTIRDFRSNGSFKVFYNYNGVNLVAASSKGPASDAYGLKLSKGWQEPELGVSCQATSRSTVVCASGRARIEFRRN